MPIYKKWPRLMPDVVSYAIDKYLSEQESERRNLSVARVWDADIVHKWDLAYVSRGVASSGMGKICLDPLDAPESRVQIAGTAYSYEPHGYRAETISDYPADLLEIVEGGAAFVEFLRKKRKFGSMQRVLDKGRITGIEATLTKAYLEFDPQAKVEPDITKPIANRRKYGPSRYSDDEKIRAVYLWDKLDKGIRAQRLDEFLDELFGNEDGTPNVPNSTFYGWKNRFGKKLR